MLSEHRSGAAVLQVLETGNDRAASSLATDARMPRGALTMAWWAVCSAMFYVFLGATVALKYGTTNALVGVSAAVITFGVLNGVFVRYAVRTGSSSSVLSRTMLGTKGGAIPTLILCATCIYYAVFEGSVLAVAASKVLPGLSYQNAVLLIVVYSTPLAVGSVQKFFDKFNGILLPFYLLGLALLVGLTVSHRGYSSAWLHVGPAVTSRVWSPWSSFVAYSGMLGLSMVTMDFARFGRVQDETYHATINFGVPFYAVTLLLSGTVGIFLIGTIRPEQITETSVVDVCLTVLGGGAGLAWVLVTQTRINSANFYIATVNLQAFLEEALGLRVPKVLCATIIGAVVLLLMRTTDVFSYILAAQRYQGIFLTAWVGVAAAHITAALRSSRGRAGSGAAAARTSHEPLPYRWRGILSWSCGVIAGLGLMALGGLAVTFSAPVTLLMAALVYRQLGVSPART